MFFVIIMDDTVVEVSKEEGNIVHNEESSSNIGNAPKESNRWIIAGEKIPKEEIVFFSQLGIIALVVLVGLVNLCLNNGTESYWAAMVATGLGSLLPSPKIKRKDIK